MSQANVQDLLSQRTVVQAALNLTPKQNVIDRLSLQRRLEAIDSALARASHTDQEACGMILHNKKRTAKVSHDGWCIETPKGKIVTSTYGRTREACWGDHGFPFLSKTVSGFADECWKKWGPSVREAERLGYRMIKVKIVKA